MPHTVELMHSWLWMNKDLSDVLLNIVCKREVSMYISTIGLSDDKHGWETPVDQSPLRAGDESSSFATSPRSLLFKTFDLHSQVICSSSLYFRARLTTSVGNGCVGLKRRFCDSGGLQLDEEMSVEDAPAAAAVLHFFYTSHLTLPGEGSDTLSPEMLLRMLQVCLYYKFGLTYSH